MQHKHTHVDREAGHSKEAGHRRYLPRPNTASPEYSLARHPLFRSRTTRTFVTKYARNAITFSRYHLFTI
jgi:hypothetical protein